MRSPSWFLSLALVSCGGEALHPVSGDTTAGGRADDRDSTATPFWDNVAPLAAGYRTYYRGPLSSWQVLPSSPVEEPGTNAADTNSETVAEWQLVDLDWFGHPCDAAMFLVLELPGRQIKTASVKWRGDDPAGFRVLAGTGRFSESLPSAWTLGGHGCGDPTTERTPESRILDVDWVAVAMFEDANMDPDGTEEFQIAEVNVQGALVGDELSLLSHCHAQAECGNQPFHNCRVYREFQIRNLGAEASAQFSACTNDCVLSNDGRQDGLQCEILNECLRVGCRACVAGSTCSIDGNWDF